MTAPPEVDPFASPRYYDRVAEETLVGWVLMHPERAVEVLPAAPPAAFHGHVARTIAEAVAALVERGARPDVDSVARELALRDTDVTKLDCVRLYAGLPGGARWETYAEHVRDAARRRALHGALLEAQADVVVEADFAAVRDRLYAALDAGEDALHRPDDDAYGPTLRRVVAEYRRGLWLFSTGFYSLDQTIRGVPRGALVIIGARTSIGKTALAATMAVDWARRGHPVSFLSVEMDRLSMAARLLGVAGELSVTRLLAGHLTEAEVTRMEDAVGWEVPLCLDDTARTLGAVRARVWQHKRVLGGKLDAVFVDYLQLLDDEVRRSSDEKRYQLLGRLSRGLKFLARDVDATVFALSQLSREADDREPRLSDLRESGNLEQDADQVWLLHRPKQQAGIKLIVAKNRQGPTGTVDLQFNAPAMTFLEMVARETGDGG